MKKTMLRKHFAILLSFLIIFSLVSCGSKQEDYEQENGDAYSSFDYEDYDSSKYESSEYVYDDIYDSETSETQSSNDDWDTYYGTGNTLSEILRNGCIMLDVSPIAKDSVITSALVFNGTSVKYYHLYTSGSLELNLTLGDASKMSDSEIIDYMEENVPEEVEDDVLGTIKCKETSEYRLFLTSDSTGNNVELETIVFGEDHASSIVLDPNDYRTGTVYDSFYCGYDWFDVIRMPDGSSFSLDEIGTDGIPVDADETDIDSFFGDAQ